MSEWISALSGADSTFFNVYIGIFRWVAPILAFLILLRCIKPLLTFRREPEIWAWLQLSNGEKLPITHWENVIGRSKKSDIVIDFPTVSRNHAVLTRYDDDRNFHADIVIFRLGENVLCEEYPLFKEHFIRYIEHICPEGSTCLFTTCFWKCELDEIIKEYAGVRGDICVELGYEDEKEMALGLYEHRGVSLHPSDYGMEMMASKIFKGVQAVLSRK